MDEWYDNAPGAMRDKITALERELTALKLAATEQATQAEAVLEERTRERDEAQKEVEALKLQAQVWASEARAQKATVHACYEAITGKTGEPGDWNGAEPIRRYVAERDALALSQGRLLEFLIPEFLEAMADIGRYGFEKYGDQSFQARRATGDNSRGPLDRCKSLQVCLHGQDHFHAYLQGTLHDHFDTLKHQLAAAAFNAMMEFYFADLDTRAAIAEATHE